MEKLLKNLPTNRYPHFFQFHTKHSSILTRFLAVKAFRQSQQHQQQEAKEDLAKALSDDDVADAVDHGAGTLNPICRAAFIRKIASILTPECIARMGSKWCGAHNKVICATMMRAAARCDDILGLSQSYDQLRAKAPKEELEVVGPLSPQRPTRIP